MNWAKEQREHIQSSSGNGERGKPALDPSVCPLEGMLGCDCRALYIQTGKPGMGTSLLARKTSRRVQEWSSWRRQTGITRHGQGDGEVGWVITLQNILEVSLKIQQLVCWRTHSLSSPGHLSQKKKKEKLYVHTKAPSLRITEISFNGWRAVVNGKFVPHRLRYLNTWSRAVLLFQEVAWLE